MHRRIEDRARKVQLEKRSSALNASLQGLGYRAEQASSAISDLGKVMRQIKAEGATNIDGTMHIIGDDEQ